MYCTCIKIIDMFFNIISGRFIYNRFGLSSKSVFYRALFTTVIITILSETIIYIIPDKLIKNDVNVTLISFALIFWAVYGYLRKEFVSKFLLMRDYLYKITEFHLEEKKHDKNNKKDEYARNKNIIYTFNYCEDCLMLNLEKHAMFRFHFLCCINEIIVNNYLEEEDEIILLSNEPVKPYPLVEKYILNINKNNIKIRKV